MHKPGTLVLKKFGAGNFWVKISLAQNICIDILTELDHSKNIFFLSPPPPAQTIFFNVLYKMCYFNFLTLLWDKDFWQSLLQVQFCPSGHKLMVST